MHYSKVRSLKLDGWEPEIFKVMMELGNDIINDIFEANYKDSAFDEASNTESSSVSKIKRATSDCDNSVREAWIKAKYVEKAFVIPLNDLKNIDIDASNRLSDIVFNENGWLIQRRQRNKIRLSADKTVAVDKQSTTDDSASGSELSIDLNRTNDDLSLGSDDSTDDDDDIATNLTEEKLENLDSNLLLYNATIVKNVPTMCYALATGASKNWTNSNDAYKTPLHRAVLSVCISYSFSFIYQSEFYWNFLILIYLIELSHSL